MNIDERIAQFQNDFEITYLAPDGRGSQDHIKQLIRDVLEEVLAGYDPKIRNAEERTGQIRVKIKELGL